MATPVNSAAWQEWMTTLMGGTMRQRRAASFPPHGFPGNQFYCLLDELPLQLIPRGSLQSRRLLDTVRQPLFLNPECSIGPATSWPDDLAGNREIVDSFALQGTMAWVRDPGSGARLPFWLGPRLESMVGNLRTGEPVPATLPEADVLVLVAAGILTAAGEASHRVREWNEVVDKAGPAFREKNYVPLRNLMHPFHVAALRRYYRYLLRQGAIQLGDPQSPLRYVAYNEPVARFFHQQTAPMVSAVAGEAVKPSYVYMASYLSGAELKKHVDREQCDFSVTLCLDFSPEPERETSWPICLDTPQGTVTVYQALGDGLAYRGMRVPHYRDVLAEGHMSTSIFFHYVAADFAGPLA
jgi:hypothetical protein